MLLLDSLGKCKQCGMIIAIEDIPEGSADAPWFCPGCGKELNHESFGFEENLGAWKRVKWIDENGQWMDKRPTKDFYLHRILVVLEPSFPS